MGRGKTSHEGSFRPALAGLSTLILAAGSVHAQQATDQLDEIIITAQRRSERLQDVPLSVEVEKPAQLEQAAITNLRDLTVAIPGLIASGAGANVSPTIRGINSQQTDPGNDSNVATYVDGVYQAGQVANAMDLPDVSQIEVLKGPQGTLFGRNAAGGAIRIFTREPSLDEATGSFDLGYGNYNDVVAKGFFSAPLIADKLAASISGYYEKSDGWDHDLLAGTTSPGIRGKSVRVKLLAKPWDNTSIELFGSYVYHFDGQSTAYEPLDGNTVARGVPGAIIPTQPFHYAMNAAPSAVSTVYTGGVHVTVNTSVGEFSSLSSYNQTSVDYYSDGDGSSVDIVAYPISERMREISQELLYTSKQFGLFQVTGGANYYKDTALYDPLISEGLTYGIPLYGYMGQITSAYAGFGELRFQPTDRLLFIAGARESDERRVASGDYYLTASHPPSLPSIGEVVYRSFTPRVSVRYTLDDDGDNVYYTYSQGFKSGGFDLSSLQTTPFKPERLVANEIGLKTSPSRVLSANISLFHYNYTDQQVMTIVDGSNLTSNAASSHINGMDADITARITREFSITAGISALNAKYESFPNAAVLVPAGGPGCMCGNDLKTDVNLSGTPTPFSPKFTVSVGPEYKTTLAPGALALSAYVYYTSRFNYDYTVVQGDYATLAARASFQPTDSKFSYYIWGKNLTSTHYFYTTLLSNFGNLVSYAEPATYGAGVRYEF